MKELNLSRDERCMADNIEIHDSDRNGKLYGGVTNKFGVSLNSIDYIVKMQKDGNISSVYSEYVASHFINALGFQAQETYLGVYSGEPVVIVRDFTTKDLKLQSFNATGQSSEDTDVNAHTGYSYLDIEYLITKHTKMSSFERLDSLKSFWTAFLLDAILGNRDRHGGNWGFLTDKSRYVVAPMYDNGGSLFPDVSTVIAEFNSDKEHFVKERSSFFPASLIKGENDKRLNYFDAIHTLCRETVFYSAYLQFIAKADEVHVHRALRLLVHDCRNAGIDELYIEFYVMVIATRYFHMICRCDVDDAYSKALCLVGDLLG